MFYGMYLVLVLGILLYALFPSDAVRNHIVSRCRRDFPDVQVSIQSVRPCFPPALSLSNVAVSRRETVLFVVDQISISPEWLSFLTSDKAFALNGAVCQGNLSATVRQSSIKGVSHTIVVGSITGCRLEKISFLAEQSSLGLSGLADASFQADLSATEKQHVKAELSISPCTVLPPESLPDADLLTFSRVHAVFAIDDNLLKIQNGEVDGDELGGSISGDIGLKSPAAQSTLNLDISVPFGKVKTFVSKLNTDIPAGLFSSSGSEQSNFKMKLTGTMGDPIIGLGSSR